VVKTLFLPPLIRGHRWRCRFMLSGATRNPRPWASLEFAFGFQSPRGSGVGVNLGWEREQRSGVLSCAGPFEQVIVTLVDVTREQGALGLACGGGACFPCEPTLWKR